MSQVREEVQVPEALENHAAGPLLTVDDLCSWLKVKQSWVYDACRDQGFPVYRLGRTMRFDPAEVTQWAKRKSS